MGAEEAEESGVEGSRGGAMATKKVNLKSVPIKITPLWIVATFVTLTETVLGVAVTQVTGGVQVALTCFVIIFAVLVASAFFAILWSRPYVFYSPSEYGETDPRGFIDAMRGRLPDQIAQQIEEAEAMPQDEAAQFALIDGLIDDAIRQHLILMREKMVSIPITEYFVVRFETGKANGSWMSGGISGTEIVKKVGGSGLVSIDVTGPSVKLTEMGIRFASWLVEKGRRNDYYASKLGGWGAVKRPEDIPSAFFNEPNQHPQSKPKDEQAEASIGPIDPNASSEAVSQ
jgi:hypothetical protein